MISIHQDPWYTFRFADDRRILRFHLDGAPIGRAVSVYWINPDTGERIDLLTRAVVGREGWVDLSEPIIVHAGQAFIVLTDPDS